MKARCLPGITKWNTYGGRARRSYDLETPVGKYSVSSVTDRRGRPSGYIATVADVRGTLIASSRQGGLHAWIRPDGTTANFPVRESTYRSPAAAAKAAEAHCRIAGGRR